MDPKPRINLCHLTYVHQESNSQFNLYLITNKFNYSEESIYSHTEHKQ